MPNRSCVDYVYTSGTIEFTVGKTRGERTFSF